MDKVGSPRSIDSEQRRPDWFERATKTVLVVVAVLGLTQEKSLWFPYVIAATLVLLSLPFGSRQVKRWKSKAKQNQALATFTNDMMSFVNRAQSFVQSTNQYGIPYFLRNIVTRPEIEVKRYSPFMEDFFSQVLRNLQARVKAGFGSYAEFEQVSLEFYGAMDSFVLIFVDDMLRELKQQKNLAAMQPHEISGLKQRYSTLNGFINEYNGFRSKLAVYWGEKDVVLQIRIPTETLD